MEIRDCKEVKKYLGTLVFFPCSSIQTKHKKEKELGSGGGASGKAMAFCLSEPGLNTGGGSSFLGNAINPFSLDGRSIAKESVTNGEYSSFFFFPISLSFRNRKPFSCTGLINLESKSKIQKEAGKGSK